MAQKKLLHKQKSFYIFKNTKMNQFLKTAHQLVIKTNLKVIFLLGKLGIIGTTRYYTNYFRLIDLIRKKSDFKSRLLVNLIYYDLLLMFVHYLAMYLLHDRLSPEAHIANFNYVFMEHFPAYFNLFGTFDLLLVAQITGVLYFKNTGLCSNILRDILLDRSTALFLRPRIRLRYRAFKLFELLYGYKVNANSIADNLAMMGMAVKTVVNVCLLAVGKFGFLLIKLYKKNYRSAFKHPQTFTSARCTFATCSTASSSKTNSTL